MARPNVQSLNRATGVTSSRQRAAPGVAVQAPLDVSVGPNSFQALAEILGVGASVAVQESRIATEERIKEEEELIAAEAEAEFYGEKVDRDQYEQSKTYRKRVDLLSGVKAGTELSIDLQKQYQEFVQENPLADEKQLREWYALWKERALLDDEGNPLPFNENTRAKAIVESTLNEAAYTLISGHRKGYLERVKAKGGAEAQGLFLANAKQRQTVTTGDYEALRSQMKSFGFTDAQVNTAVAQVAIAAGRELGDHKVIEALPEVWADGSPTAALDADLLTNLTTQKEILKAKAEAARLKGMERDRFLFQSDMDDKILNGTPFTEEDYARGVALGYSGDALASIRGQINRSIQSQAEEAEREADEANKDAEELANLRANPFGATESKAEEIYGGAYDRAVEVGDFKAAGLVIREAISRGVLPRTYRNVLNRVPPDAEGFKTWHRNMRTLDNMDDQVFASLSSDARITYEAYNGLMALAKFDHNKAFQRLQARNPERGRIFVKSKAGVKAIQEITGGSTGSMVNLKAAELLMGFASLDDFSDEEAAYNAKKSFEKTYFIHENKLYNRAQIRSVADIDYVKKRVARDRTEAGDYTDPDDLEVMPASGTDEVFVRVRNEPTDFVTIPVSEIRSAIRKEAAAGRKRKSPARIDRAKRDAQQQGLEELGIF